MVFLFFPGVVLFATNIKQIYNKKIVLLSGASFEVYLWHVPMYGLYMFGVDLLNISISHTYLTMLLFGLLVECFAIVFFKYFETPVVQKLNKLYITRYNCLFR